MGSGGSPSTIVSVPFQDDKHLLLGVLDMPATSRAGGIPPQSRARELRKPAAPVTSAASRCGSPRSVRDLRVLYMSGGQDRGRAGAPPPNLFSIQGKRALWNNVRTPATGGTWPICSNDDLIQV